MQSPVQAYLAKKRTGCMCGGRWYGSGEDPPLTNCTGRIPRQAQGMTDCWPRVSPEVSDWLRFGMAHAVQQVPPGLSPAQGYLLQKRRAQATGKDDLSGLARTPEERARYKATYLGLQKQPAAQTRVQALDLLRQVDAGPKLNHLRPVIAEARDHIQLGDQAGTDEEKRRQYATAVLRAALALSDQQHRSWWDILLGDHSLASAAVAGGEDAAEFVSGLPEDLRKLYEQGKQGLKSAAEGVGVAAAVLIGGYFLVQALSSKRS